MPPKAKNTPQATRSLRSKGPAVVVQDVPLADSGTSGPNRTGTTPQPPAVDAPRDPDIPPQAEKLVMKIPLRRRAKALAEQPTPVVAQVETPVVTQVETPVVAQEALPNATETLEEPGSGARSVVAVSDLCPGTTAVPTSDLRASATQDDTVGQAQLAYEELEHSDSDLEFEPSSPKRFPKGNLPKANSIQPSPSTGSPILERYRRLIESRGEPLYRQITGVSEEFLHDLEKAGRLHGGPKAVLARLMKVAHLESVRRIRDDLMEDDGELERNTEQEDGSGREYSPNLLECVRRMIIVEAKIRQGSQAGKNRKKTAGKTPPGGLSGIREGSGEDISINTGSDFEGSDHEDEPAKCKEENRGRKQRNKQDGATTCDIGDGEGSGEGETPRYIRRTKLSKEDLQFATDLWDDVINPTCIKFEKETGKPAEAMREAIAGVITRHVRQNNNWNIWQKVWWKRHSKDYDGALRKQRCWEEYQAELKRHKTQEEVEAWTRELEDDLARVHALNVQTRAAKKVVDVQRELINISSRAARDKIHVLFFACAVNPYNQEAEAMSGAGVGSEEMRSILVDNNQLPALQLMLSDLKLKLANLEFENRKAGKLPPVLGSGCMLKLAESSETVPLDPLTTFKVFERENVTGRSDLIPQVDHDDALVDHDDCTGNKEDLFPPLPANEALANAVSQVQIEMDRWAPLHVFKLFVVLVEPPPGLDLSAIEGLGDYLARLLVIIGGLIENGTRDMTNHCWWLLLALCRRSKSVRRRADWKPILQSLKKGQKRLVNWCPSVEFPVSGGFPKSRQTFRNMVNMFFNPDPARRLRLVRIDGAITDETPIIVNPFVPNGAIHGCTVANTVVTVDASSAWPWYQPMGALREPGVTTQRAVAAFENPHHPSHTTSSAVVSASADSLALLPMTQGLGSGGFPLEFDFRMDSRHFAPSDPTTAFSFPSSTFVAPGPAAGPYGNDPRGLPFGPLATMGSSSGHLPDSSVFDPYTARKVGSVATSSARNTYPSLGGEGAKRKSASPQVRDEPKRRRTGEPSGRVVQHAGYQGATTGIGLPVPVATINRPPDMSMEDYVKMLESKLAAGSGAPALN